MIPKRLKLTGSVALISLCLFASSFSLARDSSLDTSASIGHVMGSHMSALGLPNFGQVTPNLFRGAQPEADGYKTLEAMGVSIVIDMSGSKSEQRVVEKLGMQYVSMPWDAHSPSDEILARFLRVIHDNPDKKIFVHCHIGVDRTGMAIASYRMAKGWSAHDAMREMQLFGFSGFHRLRFPALVRFEKEFPEHLKTASAFQQ